MSTVSRPSPHDDPEVASDLALAEYLARIDLGERVDRRKFLLDHPEVAAELQDYFATAEILDSAVAELSSCDTPAQAGDITTPARLEPTVGHAGLRGATATETPPPPVSATDWLRRGMWLTAVGILSAIVLKLLTVAPVSALGAKGLRVRTRPPATHGVLIPRSPYSGLPDREQIIQARSVDNGELVFDEAPPGEYLLEVARAGHGFQEVIRRVPAEGESPGPLPHQHWLIEDGQIVLSPVAIPPAGPRDDMAYLAGSRAFRMGDKSLPTLIPEHFTAVGPFWLDCEEVTAAAFDDAHVETHDSQASTRPRPAADAAVSYVTFDEAVAFAESAGKRLPDEQEYEFAATGGGSRKYPWGDAPRADRTWKFGSSQARAFDRTPGNPPIVGLFSNVAEWTWSANLPYPSAPPDAFHDSRLPIGVMTVRGGPYSVVIGKPDSTQVAWGPRYRQGIARGERHPGLGFRCAQSAAPRFLPREPELESLFEPDPGTARD